MPRRAVLVDDERLARVRLRLLIDRHPELQVVGEADSVRTAVPLVTDTRPHVVFLDVQMPEEPGFALLERVDPAFQTVFVTAFDQYAVRAFDLNALDYLLKPVRADRLAATITRLLSSSPVPEAARGGLSMDDSLFLSFAGRPRFVRVSAIRCILAAGPYSEVTTVEGGCSLVLRSLADWESRLPAGHFARIHRSAIVNMDQVERMENAPGYRCHVYLRGAGDPLVMSRRHAARLRRASR
ncbi:MAG TPA: LytTR family DNA-binding domain-containing protein [Vicinamibacterales bacterium]|nr:LytTR family DNA-binding domain-containing protein [Vicinamibacterales bacterium]